MDRKLVIIAALVSAVGIGVLFVLPAYDVPPTAMRAWRAARVLAQAMSTLVLLAIIVTRVQICALADVADPPYFCPDVLDSICSRLC